MCLQYATLRAFSAVQMRYSLYFALPINIEKKCSSETSVNKYEHTQRYIPEQLRPQIILNNNRVLRRIFGPTRGKVKGIGENYPQGIHLVLISVRG